MQSSLIGKIEKAKHYAEEKGRVSITSLSATFRGDHNSYQVDYDGGRWSCTCFFFSTHGLCSHTMALERMLGWMPTQEPAAH